MSRATHTNRLIDETSPYLLQHAHNPVDWHAWNAPALDRAKREDKPILLSIGYSACHWCHVMEHESFEDEQVARVMNSLYVCIKVDREERPDLDKIYQTAHQVLAQRGGGWPLTMFLSPHDHMPFFGGTYFPKTARYGLPGFAEVLERVARFYHEHRATVVQQNDRLRDVFARLQPKAPEAAEPPGAAVIANAVEQLRRQYDARHGGFGQAPKFPHPSSIELLLRTWARGRAGAAEDRALLQMAQHTLRAMALGGIYDQLGGGFCRYSVDDQWVIPHFEKMLYDNAQLLTLYADAHAATTDALFRRTALGIAGWVQREMQSPDGGYYSSLDADSESHEGKYYVWDAPEVQALLTPPEWEVVRLRYGFDGQPNFEGRYHLHTYVDTPALATRLQTTEADIETTLAAAHAKLTAAREQRVRPARDDKILTSWNALMIKAMARAAWRLDQPALLTSAQRAFDFVRTQLWKNGRLLATVKDGKAHLNAYLDDYAFLIDAGLELLQAQWRDQDLAFVLELAHVLKKHFEDSTDGGFFFTADDHESLLYRPRPVTDEATPAGNGIAAQVCGRLGHLLGDPEYLATAERTVQALSPSITEYPAGHASLIVALEETLQPPQTVLVRGKRGAMTPWLAHARTGYVPWRLTFGIPDDAADLPGVLSARRAEIGIAAYLCEGLACAAPLTDITAFADAMTVTRRVDTPQ